MRCQTTRTRCAQEATWALKTKCCNTEYRVCGQHASEVITQWQTPEKYMFVCRMCGMQDMPKPEWRTL